MAISKENLRLNGSNYYRVPNFSTEPSYHTVVKEDAADLGRVCIKKGIVHAMWPIVGRFNRIVDPIEEPSPGKIIMIPNLQDFKNLQNV